MALTKTYQIWTGNPLEKLGDQVTSQLVWNTTKNQFEGKWYVQTKKYRGDHVFNLKFKSHGGIESKKTQSRRWIWIFRLDCVKFQGWWFNSIHAVLTFSAIRVRLLLSILNGWWWILNQSMVHEEKIVSEMIRHSIMPVDVRSWLRLSSFPLVTLFRYVPLSEVMIAIQLCEDDALDVQSYK